MNVPGLGEVTWDEEFSWYQSQPLAIPLLGGQGRIILEGYDTDPRREDFHAAIARFLAAPREALRAAEGAIFAYYREMNAHWEPGDEDYVAIESPEGVWRHIEFGEEPGFSRREEDGAIYCSLECWCAWEREHGLQIVLRHGDTVCKVGPYDGHLTHSDAYDDPSLEDVIYPGYVGGGG